MESTGALAIYQPQAGRWTACSSTRPQRQYQAAARSHAIQRCKRTHRRCGEDVVDTAIHGGSLEKYLRESLRSALIDTAAAQGANAIGDLSATGALDDFTNKIAHAIAGCAAGAARADNASGCGAGSLGAVIGEISGNAYGRDEFGNLRPGAVQMAQMFAGIAGAMAGLDAKDIGIAASAGANAAANNALSLRGSARLMTELRGCSGGSNVTCDVAQLRQEMTRDADKQAQRIESACSSPSNLGQCMALVTSANLSLTNLITGYEYANTEEKKALVGDLLGRQLDDMSRLYESFGTQQEAAGVRELLVAAITGSVQVAGMAGINIAAKGLENQNPLYKAAVQPFAATDLSNAGRALTKHPEVIGQTKDTLRQALRTDGAINDAAHSALRDIMRNGVTTTPTLGRYGTVTQTQVPGGFGARWASDGSFIGFINP